jgi:DNA replication ATP-dependent helicase Dna2
VHCIDHIVCVVTKTVLGFGISMLMALAEKYPDSVAQLTMQYRMNRDICELSNSLAYEGKLKCANAAVAARVLDFNSFRFDVLATSERWLQQTLNPSQAVVFVDTDKPRTFDSNGVDDFESLEHSVEVA